MKKKVRFSLVYRDMWQSSGKFQPRKDQLARIAPVIIEMGCFDRVETNGGAFEQVNLLAGENPNEAVRAFCKPFNEVGIKTHMLDRGLNALRMYPVPDDVRQLMYKVKKKQGTDITRIFCGLNDVRNIIPSIKWAKEGGMIPQATLCITTSPIHTAEYYSAIADQLIEAWTAEFMKYTKRDQFNLMYVYWKNNLMPGLLSPPDHNTRNVDCLKWHFHHVLQEDSFIHRQQYRIRKCLSNIFKMLD